jgi:succinate dehydrogenase / fumarate reductase, cytochrome b subunit
LAVDNPLGESDMKNSSYPLNFVRWFDPRSRSIGTWAFILNRITALGLTLYLFIHLIVLGKLAQGPQAYDEFLAFAHNPVVVFGELLVIAAGFIHGLNGIRIALTSFGVGTRIQTQIFLGIMLVSIIGTIYFAIRMFGI